MRWGLAADFIPVDELGAHENGLQGEVTRNYITGSAELTATSPAGFPQIVTKSFHGSCLDFHRTGASGKVVDTLYDLQGVAQVRNALEECPQPDWRPQGEGR